MSSDDAPIQALVQAQNAELEALAAELAELQKRIAKAENHHAERSAQIVHEEREARALREAAYAPSIASCLAAERRYRLHQRAVEDQAQRLREDEQTLQQWRRERERLIDAVNQARARFKATETRLASHERERTRKERLKEEGSVDDLVAARWYAASRKDDDASS